MKYFIIKDLDNAGPFYVACSVSKSAKTSVVKWYSVIGKAREDIYSGNLFSDTKMSGFFKYYKEATKEEFLAALL